MRLETSKPSSHAGLTGVSASRQTVETLSSSIKRTLCCASKCNHRASEAVSPGALSRLAQAAENAPGASIARRPSAAYLLEIQPFQRLPMFVKCLKRDGGFLVTFDEAAARRFKHRDAGTLDRVQAIATTWGESPVVSYVRRGL